MASRLSREPSEKIYRVLVHGADFPDHLEASGWLAHDSASPIARKRAFFTTPMPEGESAHTSFVKLASGNGFSLLEATLHTGRMHQIRATLWSLGYPVAGDKIYGVDETVFLRAAKGRLTLEDSRRLILQNQALHAWKIAFPKLNLSFEAPMPQAWDPILNNLTFLNS